MPSTSAGEIELDDVVQLDPDKCRWGAVFVVVTEVKTWGIVGYFMTPQGPAYIRSSHGEHVRIGKAVWIARATLVEV